MEASKKNIGKYYSNDYYNKQVNDSLKSAREIVQFLWHLFQPKTVVDVGCGRGTWLKAWLEAGAENAIGYDGPWNSQNNMVDQAIVFHSADLNQKINFNRRADLAISLEVAEHLNPESSNGFIKNLTEISNVVFFSAAFSEQGGQNHINERPHSFWRNLFKELGYESFDLIRPKFWANEKICWWYRQNSFIYVFKNSKEFESLISAGISPLKDDAIVDCIHPELYLHRLHQYNNVVNSKTYKIVEKITILRRLFS